MVHAIAYWLVIIGGVNWGLVGAFDWNLVEVLFGQWPIVVTVLYIAVGLSAIAMLFKHGCKACRPGKEKKK